MGCAIPLSGSSICFQSAPSTTPEYYANIFFDLQTNVNTNGKSVTMLMRMSRPNKEDRVAKFEWAANGGLGRVIIGKVLLDSITFRYLKLTLILSIRICNQWLTRSDRTRPYRYVTFCGCIIIRQPTSLDPRGRPHFQCTRRICLPVATKRDKF